MKKKLYTKHPNSISFRSEAFAGRISFSAAGIYGMFFCHPILSIEDIQKFSKDPKEDIEIYFQELINEGFVQEVENE